jgi:hypothetical protein
MKTSSTLPTPTLGRDRTAVGSLLKRSAAFGGRTLNLARAKREVLLVGLTVVLGLSPGVATILMIAVEPPPAGDAGALLLQSQAFVAGAPSFEMEQIKVEKVTPHLAGKPIAPARERTESLMMRVVNSVPMLTELITTDSSGLPLRVIRRGKAIVMKLGEQPWQVPSGPYLQLKDQLATPYACPLPAGGSDSPQWRLAGSAQEQGEACDVIETVGDSAVGYVTGIMNKTMMAAARDSTTRPSIQVRSYVSRHWIAQSDGRRMRVEQVGRMQLSVRQPTGQTVEVDLETTGTTRYRRYGEVRIEIPAEAERLLAAPTVTP